MNNKYDEQEFFDEYAKMSRSTHGLKAAGEWHQLEPLIPDVTGQSVLDLGCGYGWHCKYSEEQGASEILGLDSSSKMIDVARKRNNGELITYAVCQLEEYDYPVNRWDLVISNLVLHYITDLDSVFKNIFKTLKNDGILLFNIEHPIFTAGINQDFVYDSDKKPIHWPVDNYFIKGERNTTFLGCNVVKQHHTISDILTALIGNGFRVETVKEPTPSEAMMNVPGMEYELKRPMMLIIKASVRK